MRLVAPEAAGMKQKINMQPDGHGGDHQRQTPRGQPKIRTARQIHARDETKSARWFQSNLPV